MKLRFTGWVLAGVVVAVVGATGTTQEPTRDSAQVYESGNGVSWPTLIKHVKPQYTAAARSAKIEGVVKLRAVVNPDGHVDRVRVMQSLDTKYGLDDEAIKCAEKWTFGPAKKDGKPVAVWVDIELDFRIHLP
jgi:protein TonB